MTSKEFSDYCTFYRLFPWDYGFAMLAALISNMMAGENDPKKTVGDFMPADSLDYDPLAATMTGLRQMAKANDNGEH